MKKLIIFIQTAAPKAKKNQKRSTFYGFTPSAIPTGLDNFRKYPAGNWRQIGKLKVLLP